MITPGTVENTCRTGWPLSSTLPPVGALTAAAGTARGYVRAVLQDWGLGGLADDSELVVSEIVTNAVNASANPDGTLAYVAGHTPVIRVCLMSDGRQLLIEVHDQAPGQPMIQHADPVTAESGRGLAMIDALTDGQWGWHPSAEQPGKCVWAVLEAAPVASSDLAARFRPLAPAWPERARHLASGHAGPHTPCTHAR